MRAISLGIIANSFESGSYQNLRRERFAAGVPGARDRRALGPEVSDGQPLPGAAPKARVFCAPAILRRWALVLKGQRPPRLRLRVSLPTPRALPLKRREVRLRRIPREFSLSNKDMDEHGITKGCPGCIALHFNRSQQPHTEGCRGDSGES